jgi:hypothetical protein
MGYWRNAATLAPVLWFIAIFLGGIIVGMFFTSEGGCKAIVVAGVIAAIIGVFVGSISYRNIVKRAPVEVALAADNASKKGIEAKKAEVAMRYAELLNYQFTEMLPNNFTDYSTDSGIVKICVSELDARSNCWPYEHEVFAYTTTTCVSRDDDGNCTSESETDHYYHDPDVVYLVRYAGRSNLPDKYATSLTNLVLDPTMADKPLMFFSDWMLPQDYANHWAANFIFGVPKYDLSNYTPPVDWLMYANQLQNGLVGGVTSWHQYSNPLLATANADFVGDPATIAKLQEANMLLTPRDLYSPSKGSAPTYFDFIYPLGKIAQANIDWKSFSAKAQTVNMYYGNALHISNSFAFVYESELDSLGISLDTLMYSIKADLYNESKWFHVFGDQTLYTIMQQNTILVVCTVSDETEGLFIKPNGCRVMSGLPIGNETLKTAFESGLPNELKDIRLTPESFFGDPQIVQNSETGALAITGTQGHPMGLWEVYGAKKPSMDENFGYLVDRVVLTSDQIYEVVQTAVTAQKAVTKPLYAIPWWIIVAEIVLGLFTLLESKSH